MKSCWGCWHAGMGWAGNAVVLFEVRVVIVTGEKMLVAVSTTCASQDTAVASAKEGSTNTCGRISYEGAASVDSKPLYFGSEETGEAPEDAVRFRALRRHARRREVLMKGA